ncbi:MAG: arginase family protein [Actinobacteria bacterium]|nr:arginase family protein [Actinomycetota bacterium]
MTSTNGPHADLEDAGKASPLLAMPPHSFFGAPVCHDLASFDQEVALLGVPYDQGSLIPYCRVGQSQGPNAVRTNPTFFYGGNPFDGPPDPTRPCVGFHCIDDGKEYLAGVTMADIGDVVIPVGDLKAFVNTTTEVARQIAARNAVLASVGGDHSIAFPLVRGMEPWGDIELIHFDSHFDVRDAVAGSRYSHSSPIHRISELPFVERITQFGIRNFVSRESLAMVEKIGSVVVPGSEMHRKGPAEAVAEYAPEGKNVYVTIDTDFFDWSIVPGTVLPEPGGFTLQEFRECMQVIVGRSNVVGFDVVCLNPLVDSSWYGGVTTRLVSYVMAYTLGYIFDARQRLVTEPVAATAAST